VLVSVLFEALMPSTALLYTLAALPAIIENRTAELHQFLCTLPVAVARSSYDGVAIRYAFPVSWMTSCFRTMGPMALHVRILK